MSKQYCTSICVTNIRWHRFVELCDGNNVETEGITRKMWKV